jgi:cysteine-rich repeat protein
MRHSFGLCLVAALVAGCTADEQVSAVEQEVVTGSFAQRFDNTLIGGGVVVQGASMAGRLDGLINTTATINIAGIPAGSTVTRAVLYWTIVGGSDTTATINGNAVTGASIGSAGHTCWNFAVNTNFRADVTAHVSGNGAYTIGGLPSTTAPAGPDTDGVALVVTYQNLTSSARRRVLIRDGIITTDNILDTASDTFSGLTTPIAGPGGFHIVVGDGQSDSGTLTLAGVPMQTSPFTGSDGSLWDTRSYPLDVGMGLTNPTWSFTSNGDCLAFVAGVFDVQVALCGDGARTGGETCDQGGGVVSNGDGCNTACEIEPGWTCTGTPSLCKPICGDGVRLGSEQCDDGDATGGDGCSATCTIEPGWQCTGNTPSVCTTVCGDGIRTGAEACDDGDAMSGDGCSATCTVEPGWNCTGTPSACTTTCGDGIVAGTEQCDDHDNDSGDGCSATCAVEDGWTCSGQPSTCGTLCGDGVIAGTETCDQGNGNVANGDGCSSTCMIEPGWQCEGEPSTCSPICGDGVIAGSEACDDGNTTASDGCSRMCTVEPGWTCAGMPSGCDEICGDGLVVGSEECDDDDTDAGDGCSATCTVEDGWTCTGEPSLCVSSCGDGMKLGAETCDDGNTIAGDGCSATCTVEDGWDCSGPTCFVICGDGKVIGNETCDDGNSLAGDGCSDTCLVEDNWLCSDNAPSTCERLAVAGGGCSTGGGSNGLVLVGLVGLLVLGRRRRASTSALIAASAVTVLVAVPAHAQSVSGSGDFSAERFRLAMDRNGILSTESARTTGHLVIDVGLWLGYANDPITVRVGNDHDRVGALVADRFGGDLVASIGLTERFELGFAAPVILSQDESLGSLMTNGSLSSAGLGDITVTPKVSLLRGPVDLGIAAALTLPTSGGDNFFGEDSVTFSPALLVGAVAGPARIFANLGYRLREATQMATLDVDDEMFARLGLGVRAGRADVMFEASLATPASAPLDEFNANYAELRAGLGVDLSSNIRAFAAGGVGLANGYGTPDWRGLVGVWIGSGKPKQEPVEEPLPAPPAPDTSDDDGDGIVGAADKCPNEPENVNNFQDDDGCPDTLPDTDQDGIVDPIDKCPERAEDKDAFEDDDGCPEDDNDQDGVLDAADKCPLVAGVVENGGCPDTDKDGDTVVDRLDNCPDEPGTVKNNGCKDKQLVVFTGDSIKLLDVVYFDTNKATLQKRSNKLLENVAKVINAHPEITKVTVEGHTDDRGNDAKNKDLSQRRAQSVVAFLVSKQVKAELLTPIGFGEDQPIQSNRTEAGRAANRRVEFKVESGAPAPQQ